MDKKDNIASVLAFEKKLVPSDGYMYGTKWEERHLVAPLKLQEKSVRGTISNRLKAAVKNDPAKLNAEVEKANLQRVDACALAPEQDTLKLQFSLKILGGIAQPSACNNSAFKKTYSAAAKNYVEREGFCELARRYTLNLASARFLWRNRVGAESIEVEVNALNKGTKKAWTFDATQFSTRDFNADDAQVNDLAARIACVLASEEDYLIWISYVTPKSGNLRKCIRVKSSFLIKVTVKKRRVKFFTR